MLKNWKTGHITGFLNSYHTNISFNKLLNNLNKFFQGANFPMMFIFIKISKIYYMLEILSIVKVQ